MITPAGAVATSAAGVQVTFDSIPAPLLMVSAAEIQCIAPFGLTGRTSTSAQVQYNGVKSNAVLIPVSSAALSVLAVLNEDFTPNSPSNPARAGSIITLYITGVGQTNPPSFDGQVNQPPLAQPGTPVVVRFANDPPYEVTFAAAADGLAAGILQVNFRGPQQTTQNVNISVGGSLTYFNVAVQ